MIQNSISDISSDSFLHEMVNPIPGISTTVLCSTLHSLFTHHNTDSLVVLENEVPIGYLTYHKVNESLSTQFGYALFQNRPVTELMKKEFIIVGAESSVIDIVENILVRDKDSFYEDLVVVKNSQYIGLLSIKHVIFEQHIKIKSQVKELEIRKKELIDKNNQLQEAIDNIKKNEANFLRIEKMASVGTLTAGIAHDFNNMLSAIYQSVGLLKVHTQKYENPKINRYCEIIEQAITRASGLTKQLLQFSGKNIVQFKITSINAIISETVKILDRSINKNIEVKLVLDPSYPMINADDGQIQQVIMNLSLNARDAMPNGGVIIITTASFYLPKVFANSYIELPPGKYVKLTIEDNGSGISEENLQKIFDPFFSTKDVGKGTGLGLAVVYGIVNKHEGNIYVESEIGKGTVFTIFFKCFNGHSNSIELIQDEQREKWRGTLLIIDDEEILQEINAENFRELGYTVLTAKSGEAGVDIYREHQNNIDLILLDLMMPVMDGYEAFSRLHEINPSVKVLLISGYYEEEKIKSLINQGAMGIVQKPFDSIMLSKRIKELLHQN